MSVPKNLFLRIATLIGATILMFLFQNCALSKLDPSTKVTARKAASAER